MSAWSRARRKPSIESQRLTSAAGLRPRSDALLIASRLIVPAVAGPQRPKASKINGEKSAGATRARLTQDGYAASLDPSLAMAARPGVPE